MAPEAIARHRHRLSRICCVCRVDGKFAAPTIMEGAPKPMIYCLVLVKRSVFECPHVRRGTCMGFPHAGYECGIPARWAHHGSRFIYMTLVIPGTEPKHVCTVLQCRPAVHNLRPDGCCVPEHKMQAQQNTMTCMQVSPPVVGPRTCIYNAF